MVERAKPIKLKTEILITVNWTWVKSLLLGLNRANLN
jgi:hypothetical protein